VIILRLVGIVWFKGLKVIGQRKEKKVRKKRYENVKIQQFAGGKLMFTNK